MFMKNTYYLSNKIKQLNIYYEISYYLYYVFHSKNLKVNYGKPFSIQNLELEDANNKLRKEIIKLMKENLRS